MSFTSQYKIFISQRQLLSIGPWFILAKMLLNCTVLFAQQSIEKDESSVHIGIGAVVAAPSVIDNHFSAIPYSSTNYGATVFFRKETLRCNQEFKSVFFKGKLSGAGFKSAAVNQYFTADYTRLYSITNPEGSLPLRLGPQLSALYVKRNYEGFVNRKRGFEFAGSVAVSAMVQHTFTSGFFEGVSVSDRLDIPLISVVQHPAYGSQESEGNLNSEGSSKFFKGSKVSAIPDFFRLRNNVELIKEWNRHGISVIYSWDYYQLKKLIAVKQAAHIIAVSYTLKL